MDLDLYGTLQPRSILDWPEGDNDTDTIVHGHHYNLTNLEHYKYTLFSNDTISNGTKCYLAFEPYMPIELWNNGSWHNATWCYWAVKPLSARGNTGIGLAAAFGLTLVLVLTVLTKHGKLYLPREERFYPIGRRWQWYWGSIVCALALVSLLMNIDVDRFWLASTPIVVTTFFWFLMCMASMSIVWEAVRHWGSWLERQYIDHDRFCLREDDRRAKIEFWIPLWYYFWFWMNFFMVIPRNWDFVTKQRDDDQLRYQLIPVATGARFKAAAFFLFICWLTICFSLFHSIYHYKPRHRGIFNRAVSFVGAIPLRFVLLLPMSLSIVGYQALQSFDFDYSVMKVEGSIPIIFGWGYGVPLLILWVQVIYGFAAPNEDKELIRQRRERGDAIDRELGIVHRPAWWRRVKGEHLLGFRDKLVRNVQEVGGEHATGRRTEEEMERHIRENMRQEARDEDDIEMHSYNDDPHNPRVDRAGARSMPRGYPILPGGKNGRRVSNPGDPQFMQAAARHLFPNGDENEDREREEQLERERRLRYITEGAPTAEEERARRIAYISGDGPPPPPYSSRPVSSAARSNSTASADSINRPATQVRSMLDI